VFQQALTLERHADISAKVTQWLVPGARSSISSSTAGDGSSGENSLGN